LTLDTPLFSHRIKLVKTSVVVTDPEPYPVAYLRIEQAELEEKLDWSKPTVSELRQTLGLDDEADSFDETSRGIYDGLTDGFSGSSSSATPRGPSDELSALSLRNDSDVQDTRFASTGRWFSASVDGQSLDGETIGDELRRCFEALKGEYRVVKHDIANGTRFLESQRSGTFSARNSHHIAALVNGPIHTRQRCLHHIFRYFAPKSSDCCCAFIIWREGPARGRRL
jgi:diphthine-ammonia ligase